MSAKFKTLPNYEYIRNGLHIAFNGEGYYETNEEAHIKALESAKPFIQRIDADKNDDSNANDANDGGKGDKNDDKPKKKTPKKQPPKSKKAETK